MKKEEQRTINVVVEDNYTQALNELASEFGKWWLVKASCRQLRSCQAWVYESKCYYVLKSYNTIVAVISKNSNTLYDALRTVYRYTATSAQHIAKFRTDYGSRYAQTFTSRYVPE